MNDLTHTALVDRAGNWLRAMHCGVVLTEHRTFDTLEQPDAIGFRSYCSILIEVKISRSDFFADRAKSFRQDPGLGMGDYRFFLAPRGLIKVDELPSGWGLIEATPKRLFKVAGGPTGNMWSRDYAPFTGNVSAERSLFYSLLRKATVKGLMPQVVETIKEEEARLAREPKL